VTASSISERHDIVTDMASQSAKLETPETGWKITGLDAQGPFPELKEKLALFGQFVGDWQIVEDRYLADDGTWIKSRGELHVNWILEGRALQDTFMTFDEKTNKMIPDGTTLRFYDSKIDAWHVVWFSPMQRAIKTLIGRKVADEIVLERTTDEGHLVNWIFSEITSSSFRWHSEESRDDGKTWTLREEMQIRRSRE
jgi:hypothetical protein